MATTAGTDNNALDVIENGTNLDPDTAPIAAASSPNAASPSTASTTASTAQSASAIINTWAQQNGLGALSDWINSQSSVLAGQGLTGTDIASTIEQTINTAPGFDQILPGYNQRLQMTGNNGGGIGTYITYINQIDQMAQQAGLTPGTISAADIGALWAGSVSTTEASDRITQGVVDAAGAIKNIPGFADFMQTNYGINRGDLVSYYLNPTNTMAQLQTNYNSAQVGAAGANTGFGAISASQAQTLSAFLAPNATSEISQGQANNAFTSNLGGQITGSAAQLASGGFESDRPGGSSTGTVTQDQLLGAITGNAPDEAAVSQAQQARTASSKGGGGATTTANGAVGLGYAQS